MNSCPCGSRNDYQHCCGPYISGEKPAPTPEALMRSRYTAYTQHNIEYIAKTMKSPATDSFDRKSTTEWAKQVKWIRLEIINCEATGTHGIVEFRAHYFFDNKKSLLHEISEFNFENDKWYYIQGTYPNNVNATRAEKIGRNQPCPCGSNKKFKNCCMVD